MTEARPRPRHFLSLLDLPETDLEALIDRAIALKQSGLRAPRYEPLRGHTLGMIFEKSSTRTRASFEVAMNQFGGNALFLNPADSQLGRGEELGDTARVLSRMVDALMVRTYSQALLEAFAAHSRVPVINGLTDLLHPCQLLADMQTYREHRGDIRGARVAWVGDGNNMCHSYVNAARRFGFHLAIACPDGFAPDPAILAAAGDAVSIHGAPEHAVAGAHLVVTDVWASMGQEDEAASRRREFAGYQVTPELLAQADPEVVFMHCLPAHRGEEITEDLLEHPASVVWDEAENRLHAQKALLEYLLVGPPPPAGLG